MGRSVRIVCPVDIVRFVDEIVRFVDAVLSVPRRYGPLSSDSYFLFTPRGDDSAMISVDIGSGQDTERQNR